MVIARSEDTDDHHHNSARAYAHTGDNHSHATCASVNAGADRHPSRKGRSANCTMACGLTCVIR
jgi:hypothetical protein